MKETEELNPELAHQAHEIAQDVQQSEDQERSTLNHTDSQEIYRQSISKRLPKNATMAMFCNK